MKEVEEVNKIDNATVEVVYMDGSTEVCSVVKINSRQEAIAKCIEVTKVELKKDDAFKNLNKFFNDFSRHRNYELEYYLDEFAGGYYRIFENCPFKGYMWFN